MGGASGPGLQTMRILLLLILGLISLEARSTFESRAVANTTCTKRVQKICDLRCSNGCLNKNRRKPGKRMSKRAKKKYCSKVSCLTDTFATPECVCPMALVPVCDSQVTKLQTTWSARSVRGGTHKIFSYAWLLLVQVSFDQQRRHINTLYSIGDFEINILA